jgi:thymidylate kinase
MEPGQMSVGQLVTISGLDGAGKSTQFQHLRGQLEAQGYRCVSYCFNVQSYGLTARQMIDRLLAANVACLFTRHSVDCSEHYPLVHDFIYAEDLQTPDLAWAVSLVLWKRRLHSPPTQPIRL